MTVRRTVLLVFATTLLFAAGAGTGAGVGTETDRSADVHVETDGLAPIDVGVRPIQNSSRVVYVIDSNVDDALRVGLTVGGRPLEAVRVPGDDERRLNTSARSG